MLFRVRLARRNVTAGGLAGGEKTSHRGSQTDSPCLNRLQNGLRRRLMPQAINGTVVAAAAAAAVEVAVGVAAVCL